MVRLKVGDLPVGINMNKFQFLMVRLKAAPRIFCILKTFISIPYGSIKSFEKFSKIYDKYVNFNSLWFD